MFCLILSMYSFEEEKKLFVHQRKNLRKQTIKLYEPLRSKGGLPGPLGVLSLHHLSKQDYEI